jgi:hypothetical protein
VTNGSVIQSGLTLSVENAVTVASSGTLTLENNATLYNLYQRVKFGNVIVKEYGSVLWFVATFDY